MTRLALLALAVVALAWLLPALRHERALERGAELAADGRAAEALAELRRGRASTPSHEARIREAQLHLFRSRPAVALRTVLPVVEDEPRNVEAWRVVLHAARTVDPRLHTRARARLRELDPLAGARRGAG